MEWPGNEVLSAVHATPVLPSGFASSLVQLWGARVIRTIVAGRTVYQAPRATPAE